MRPLKITFDMTGRFIPPDNGVLHLDGLLAWAHVQQQLLRLQRNGESISPDLTLRDLQAGMDRFLKVQHAPDDTGDHVFCASMIHVDAQNVGQVALTRKTDFHAMVAAVADGMLDNGRVDKINLNSGQYRNYLFYLPVHQAKQAVAWCIGDKQRITELLSLVRHLGRKGTIGFGRVTSITVEEDAEAEIMWQRRALPWAADGYEPISGAHLPPYWDRTQHHKVWMPMVS